MPMCTPRLLVSKVAPELLNTLQYRVKKIKSSRILKINDYTRYLALYDFVLHFAASANLGL